MSAARYLALVGHERSALARALAARDGLTPVYQSPRMMVLASGRDDHIALGPGKGVIIGTLFTSIDARLVANEGRSAPELGSSPQARLLLDHWGGYVAFLDGPDGEDIRVLREARPRRSRNRGHPTR